MDDALRHVISALALAGVIGVGASAAAHWPSPDVTFMVGGTLFASGNSNNLANAASFTFGDFWIPGACQSTDDFQRCDALRLGLSVYPRATATGSGPHANIECHPDARMFVEAQEDGGGLAEAAFGDLWKETDQFCLNAYRPLHTALLHHRDHLFPGGAGAPAAAKQQWFERPRLTLALLDELPGLSADSPRLKASLTAACELFQGVDGEVPSIPTWVMLARRHDSAVAPFARLLAAAGGTGVCCDAHAAANCVPELVPLDVCAHVATRTEAQLGSDIAANRYRCAGGDASFSTGLMDYGTSNGNGTLPHITCHLAGRGPGNGNGTPGGSGFCDPGSRPPTNVLGIFSCIRQLPYGMRAEDVQFTYCPVDALDCVTLTEANGGLTFIDPNRTLFMLEAPYCTGVREGDGDLHISSCPREGEACPTGKHGRCSIGEIACHADGTEYCRQLFAPMPELCNGLDNDCDGRVDNLSNTPVGGLPAIPAAHRSQACYGRDACVCPTGPEPAHAGTTFTEYLQAWTGACHCEGGLNELDLGFDGNADPSAPRAACAAMPAADARSRTTPRNLGLLALTLAALATVRRSRRR